jgi:hypothetical protein
MKNDRAVVIKTNANFTWVAVLDPASGHRGRYTVYRVYRWGDKQADIVGRELDLKTARKVAGKRETDEKAPEKAPEKSPKSAAPAGLEHKCDWRKAALMLAKCVVATVQTGGKIGMGSGMVMKVVDGKKTIERWDKDFIEALAFIGVEFTDEKPKPKAKRKR